MKSEFCQWLIDLQKIATPENVIVEAQHYDVLDFYYKSKDTLKEAFEKYKKFKVRYEALTLSGHDS